jgi:HAE1 family hydrophobic/amphiphilic exporter-1
MINKRYSPLIISLALVLTLLGLLVSLGLPNALLPRIDRPEIILFTNWDGKGAQEIEQTLIAPLERQMYGLDNLISTESNILDGMGRILLTFHRDADMQQMYIEVLSRINQVPGWPAQVEKPFIQNNSSGAGATLATAMMYATTPKTEAQFINAYKMHLEPALAKIPGVAGVNIGNNPADKRVDIEFDPAQLAKNSLTIEQVTNVLRGMIDRSGDSLTLGAKDYGLLFKGNVPISELGNLPIHSRGKHIIRLSDIAEIHTRLATQWSYASIHGHKAMYMILEPAVNVNALSAIDEVKQVFKHLNEDALLDLGMKVTLSRDDSKDIKRALVLVYGSIFLGITLAAMVLFFFLKNWRVVSLVFVSIPVCLSMVMLAMGLGGYSLNVISLAGMALSVGLLLDAAIVVVENILRIKHGGASLNQAITEGTAQVKGAVISSTLSSIIIFFPIMLMQTRESQLFEDLAFTISSALIASVVVALILIPTLARYFLKSNNISDGKVIQQKDDSRLIAKLTVTATNKPLASLTLFIGIPLALLYSYLAMPSFDVLPNPKQKSLRTFISFSEPMNTEAVAKRIAQPIFSRLEQQKTSGLGQSYDTSGMFCGESGCLLYFYPSENWHYESFKQWIETKIVNDFPGTRIFTQQGTLLRFVMPNSRNTQLDLKGDNLDNLQSSGRELLAHLKEQFPNANITEATPLNNQAARIEFTPKYDNLAYFGTSQATLNNHLVALTDGLYLGRFYADGDTIPFYFKAKETNQLEELLDTELVIPDHGYQPLHQLVNAKFTLAPQSLSRIDRESSVSINLSPPENMPIGVFVQQIQQQVNDFLSTHENKRLFVNYRGSADSLHSFLQEFGAMFVISLVILVLLMWLTLKSWSLAFAVILSMPLAIAGGMFNLQLLNLVNIQNLDVITMIGFIILMGLVINNAILLASQYDNAIKNGLSQQQSIVQAVALRKRPIYMSTGTTIFGMLPLMLSPGEGAEIYRGLAAVIIGGMTFSALFSLSFMSALLSLPIFKAKQHTVSLVAEAA